MPLPVRPEESCQHGQTAPRLSARFDVLLIGNRDSLCCDAADMESFLTVLNSFNIHIFAGGQGSWVEPNGRHYAPLPRLPWQEDDVAEVPQ